MFTRGTMHKLVLKLLCKLKGHTNIIMCKFNRIDLRQFCISLGLYQRYDQRSQEHSSFRLHRVNLQFEYEYWVFQQLYLSNLTHFSYIGNRYHHKHFTSLVENVKQYTAKQQLGSNKLTTSLLAASLNTTSNQFVILEHSKQHIRNNPLDVCTERFIG